MSKREKKLPRVMSRRQMMGLMGLGALCCTDYNPLSMLSRSLVDGLIASAQAQTGPEPKNFVSILYPGAPTRWVWDGFLNPRNETVVRNNSVNNWLINDTYDSANPGGNLTHRAEEVALPGGGSIYLPPIWNRSMPVDGGGAVPMKALLENALIIRGIDMQVDLQHGVGPAKVLFPIGADASLTGLVGDASSVPLPVVGFKGASNYANPVSGGYRSLKGTTPTLVDSASDAMSNTLAPFINTDTNTKANAAKLDSQVTRTAMQGATDELGRFANSTMPGADVLHKNSASATRLLRTAFGDLKNVVYPQLVNKYAALASVAAKTAIPNIIPATGTGGYNLATGRFTNEFAFQFAVTEYLLVNGFSAAISMCSQHSVGVAGLASFNDEHDESNRQQSMICHTYQFLALSPMIYELRRVLIAAGMWNRTVVHVSAEYNRSPRNDGSGSDHAANSNTITMFSGAISKPIFIGNIKTESGAGTTYSGTYGVAAPVQTDRGTMVLTNNVLASTAAAILGVRNPLTQSSSIVAVDSSGAVTASLAEAPKNV